MGPKPIIDPVQRIAKSRGALPQLKNGSGSCFAEAERYWERTISERLNARLKHEFGAWPPAQQRTFSAKV